MIVKQIKKLQKTSVKNKINKKLKEFASFKTKSNKAWFSEMCFCILTANSKAETAIKIQKDLGVNGFCNSCASDVKKCIIKNKHRFHNNKTKYIVEARKHIDIKQKLRGKKDFEAREWLVKNVKGLGYKESSHFLRNVGYTDLAILDRHILNLLVEKKIIKRPKSLTKKKYLEIEKKFQDLAEKLKMSSAELDMYMWYLKTGEVLK
jgi:N-glycosylase/DNA lyase